MSNIRKIIKIAEDFDKKGDFQKSDALMKKIVESKKKTTPGIDYSDIRSWNLPGFNPTTNPLARILNLIRGLTPIDISTLSSTFPILNRRFWRTLEQNPEMMRMMERVLENMAISNDQQDAIWPGMNAAGISTGLRSKEQAESDAMTFGGGEGDPRYNWTSMGSPDLMSLDYREDEQNDMDRLRTEMEMKWPLGLSNLLARPGVLTDRAVPAM